MGRKKQSGTERSRSGNGANLGFEEKLWAAADKMRGHIDAGEYKHVALGLIFPKYISDAFQEPYGEIKKEPNADPDDRDVYMSENVFWVPPEARWANSWFQIGYTRKRNTGFTLFSPRKTKPPPVSPFSGENGSKDGDTALGTLT